MENKIGLYIICFLSNLDAFLSITAIGFYAVSVFYAPIKNERGSASKDDLEKREEKMKKFFIIATILLALKCFIPTQIEMHKISGVPNLEEKRE